MAERDEDHRDEGTAPEEASGTPDVEPETYGPPVPGTVETGPELEGAEGEPAEEGGDPGFWRRVGSWFTGSDPDADGTEETPEEAIALLEERVGQEGDDLSVRRHDEHEDAVVRLDEGVRRIARALDGVGERIDTQNRRSEEIIDRMSELPDLLGRVAEARGSEERTLDDLKGIAAEARERLARLPAAVESQGELQRMEMEALRQVSKETRDRVASIPAVLEAHAEAVRQDNQAVRRALVEVKDQLTPLHGALEEQAEATRETNDVLRSVVSRLDAEREEGRRMARSLSAVAHGVERMGEMAAEHRNLSADLLEESRVQGDLVCQAVDRMNRQVHDASRRREERRREAEESKARRERVLVAAVVFCLVLAGWGAVHLARSIAGTLDQAEERAAAAEQRARRASDLAESRLQRLRATPGEASPEPESETDAEPDGRTAPAENAAEESPDPAGGEPDEGTYPGDSWWFATFLDPTILPVPEARDDPDEEDSTVLAR